MQVIPQTKAPGSSAHVGGFLRATSPVTDRVGRRKVSKDLRVVNFFVAVGLCMHICPRSLR